jgi:hypothetical protein
MKSTAKSATAIVGVSVLSLGLIVGTGIAANAATAGISSAARGAATVSLKTAPTPTPVRTHGPRGTDDTLGHDVFEHPTPEPGDDDAPGTTDRHGSNRGQDSAPTPTAAPVPLPAPRDRSGDDAGDDRGQDGPGHDAGDDRGSND